MRWKIIPRWADLRLFAAPVFDRTDRLSQAKCRDLFLRVWRRRGYIRAPGNEVDRSQLKAE